MNITVPSISGAASSFILNIIQLDSVHQGSIHIRANNILTSWRSQFPITSISCILDSSSLSQPAHVQTLHQNNISNFNMKLHLISFLAVTTGVFAIPSPLNLGPNVLIREHACVGKQIGGVCSYEVSGRPSANCDKEKVRANNLLQVILATIKTATTGTCQVKPPPSWIHISDCWWSTTVYWEQAVCIVSFRNSLGGSGFSDWVVFSPSGN